MSDNNIDFDSFVADEPTQPEQKSGINFDAYVEAPSPLAEKLKQNSWAVEESTPDNEATVLQLAKKFQTSPAFVRSGMDEFKKKAEQPDVDFDRLAGTNPKTSSWMAKDPSNTAIIKDEILKAKSVEDTIEEHGFLSKIYSTANASLNQGLSGLVNYATLAGDTVNELAKPLYDAMGIEATPTKELIESPGGFGGIGDLKKYFDTIAQTESAAAPEADRSLEDVYTLSKEGQYADAAKTLLLKTTKSAFGSGAMMATAALSGGTTLATAAMYASSAGGKYEELQQKFEGKDAPADSSLLLRAHAQGGIDAATEMMFGTMASFKKTAGTVIKSLEKEAGKEGARKVMSEVLRRSGSAFFEEGVLEEGTASIAGSTLDYIMGTQPEMTFKSAVKDFVEGVVVGGLAGTGMTTPSAVAYGVVKNQQLKQANLNRDTLLALGPKIQDMALRERLPEKQKELVERQAKDTALETIYVARSRFDAYFQENNDDPVAAAAKLGVTDSYEEAASSGFIKISIGDYAMKVVGTPAEQGLSKDIKFDLNDLTVNEATEAKAELAPELEAINAQVELEKKNAESLRSVEKDIEQTLIREGIAFGPEAKSQAAFKAERIKKRAKNVYGNMDPMELYKREGLKIVGYDAVPEGMQGLEQASEEDRQAYSQLNNERNTLKEEFKNLLGASGTTLGFKNEAEALSNLISDPEGTLALLQDNPELLQTATRLIETDKAAIAAREKLKSTALKQEDSAPLTKKEKAKNFKTWTEKAPVVGSEESMKFKFKTGKKVVVESFHGSKADIEKFASSALGASTGAGSAKLAFFSTNDAGTASDYAMASESKLALRAAALEKETIAEREAFNKEISEKYGEGDISKGLFKTLTEEEQARADAIAKNEAIIRDAQEKEELSPASLAFLEMEIERAESNLAEWKKHDYKAERKKLSKLIEERETLLTDYDWVIEPDLRYKGYNLINKKTGEKRINPVFKDSEGSTRFRHYDNPENFKRTLEKLNVRFEQETKKQNDLRISDAESKLSKLLQKKSDHLAASDGEVVYPIYVKMTNPFVYDFKGEDYREITYRELIEKAKEAGHDGVIFQNTYDPAFIGGGAREADLLNVYAVFDPTNIKSQFNRGTFDPNDPRILHQADKQNRIRGFFDPVAKLLGIIKGNQNRTTFLHEDAGHVFLEEMKVDYAYLKSQETLTPAQERYIEDSEAMLEYLGVESFNDIKVEHHEKFARTMEAYFLEGRVPEGASKKLKKAMESFKLWFLEAYKTLKGLERAGKIKINLTDKMRGAIDRMLVVEEEAAKAESNYTPLFKDAVTAGMSKEMLSRYLDVSSEAKEASSILIQEPVAKDYMKKQEKLYKDEKKQVKSAMMAELEKLPAQAHLTKLETDEKFKKMPKEIQAEMLGYKDVATFDKAMSVARQQRTTELDKRVDAEMQKRYPDSFFELEERAIEAVHNDQRAKKLRLEAEFLAEKASGLSKDITKRLIERLPNNKVLKAEAAKNIGSKQIKVKPV